MDYNDDGITDLAVENSGNVNVPSTETLAILKGNGDGTFTQPIRRPAGDPGRPKRTERSDSGRLQRRWQPDLAIPDSGDTYTTILLNTVTQTATAMVDNIVLAGAGTHFVEAAYPANTFFARPAPRPSPYRV